MADSFEYFCELELADSAAMLKSSYPPLTSLWVDEGAWAATSLDVLQAE